MSNKNPKTRLYINDELKAGTVHLVDGNPGHHLVNVMRISMGEYVTLFNGEAGEWLAEVTKVGKGKAKVTVREKIAEQMADPDLWYLYAPIKKTRLDYMVQKATELGVSRLCPVVTKRTNLDRIKPEKLMASCIDAAQQCGRMTVPEFDVMTSLAEKLASWPEDRAILFCDEAKDGASITKVNSPLNKWAVLIGPEGGFTAEERDMIRDHKNTVAISLGPRILRADTAAVAVLTLWQSHMGDWKK